MSACPLASLARRPYTWSMTEAALEGHIDLTPAAIDEAKKKLVDAPEGTVAFRVGLKGGGCAGFSYAYDFAKKVRDGKDHLLDFDGLAVVIDKKSLSLLDGATLDFTRELMSYGFRWHNPHAVDACGCGQSFDIKR